MHLFSFVVSILAWRCGPSAFQLCFLLVDLFTSITGQLRIFVTCLLTSGLGELDMNCWH